MPDITRETFETALIEATLVEATLVEASKGVPGPEEGLFGPASPMWQVSREAILFLGAGRAALLQTAHPFVAAAIHQHSDVRTNPAARFRRTFTNVSAMVFGTQQEAMNSALRVRAVHDHIHGELETAQGRFAAGTRYSAHDADATRWVHATLCDTALRVHDMFLPPLDRASREQYWREALRFGALFGLTAQMMPKDFAAFCAYMDEMLIGNVMNDMLFVGPDARDIADHLLKGKGTARALPDWYVSVTAGLLPPALRAAYGLSFGPLDRRRAERAIRLLGRLHRILPGKLTYAPAFHRAEARLKGKAAPDMATRGLLKLWFGQKL